MDKEFKREKALLSNTLILALGTFLPQVTALITLPIYTAMLTTQEYGRYDLINTVVYILGVVLLIQIHVAVFRFLIDVRGSAEKDTYITTTYAFEVIPSAVGSILFGAYFHELGPGVSVLLSLYLFLGQQYTVAGQVARGLGYNKVYAFGSIIQTVANMSLVVVLMKGMRLGFTGLFLSLDLAFAAGFVFVFGSLRQWRYIRRSAFSPAALKRMLAYAWPMVPNTLSIWIVNTCDKFIIRFFMGSAYNGIFAVAQKIPNIFNLAFQTFNTAWMESASLTEKDSDYNAYYSRVFRALFDFLVGCMLLLIAAAPILFRLLIRGDYSESYDQIPLLLIGMFLASICSFLDSIYVAKKASRAVGLSSVYCAVINCIVNLALIRRAGLYAASVSTVVSYLSLVVYRLYDLRRRGYAHIEFSVGHVLAGMLLMAFSGFLCYQRDIRLDLINMVIGVVMFFTLNHALIGQILRGLLEKIRKPR